MQTPLFFLLLFLCNFVWFRLILYIRVSGHEYLLGISELKAEMYLYNGASD